MCNSTMRNRLMTTAAAMMLGVTLSAPAALAITAGTVTITGTRYVDGVPHKVRCAASEGHQAVYGGGTWFHLLPLMNACDIYADTDDADVLHFDGAGSWIEKNGVKTDSVIWSATQIANGPFGSDPAHGTMTGVMRYVTGLLVSDKGTISYWRVNSLGHAIIFVGKYKVTNIESF